MIGYRVWRLFIGARSDGQVVPWLRSASVEYLWTRAAYGADEEAPGLRRGLQPGIHAVAEDFPRAGYHRAAAGLGFDPAFDGWEPLVQGAVELSGTVIEHEDGVLRGERARILALRLAPVRFHPCPEGCQGYYLVPHCRSGDLYELLPVCLGVHVPAEVMQWFADNLDPLAVPLDTDAGTGRIEMPGWLRHWVEHHLEGDDRDVPPALSALFYSHLAFARRRLFREISIKPKRGRADVLPRALFQQPLHLALRFMLAVIVERAMDWAGTRGWSHRPPFTPAQLEQLLLQHYEVPRLPDDAGPWPRLANAWNDWASIQPAEGRT